MSGWLDGWRRVDNPRTGGGTYDPENEGYPWRIVLHTIEGRNIPNTAAHQYPPQLWYNPATREKIQTIPLDRSGFALYQSASAPYYTNRARAIQVELVGFAAEAGAWPDSHLVNIAQDVVVPVVEWVRNVGGNIDLSDPAVPLPGAIPNSARENAPQRLHPDVWAFGPIGLCSHRHVPMGDDHWDTGALDTRRIRDLAVELLGGLNPGNVTPGPSQPSPWEDDEMAIQMMSDPAQGGDGTVYMMFGPWCWAFSDDAIRVAFEQTGTLKPGILKVHQATINGYDYQGVLEHDMGTLKTGPTPPTVVLEGGQYNAITQGVNNSYQNLAAQNAATLAAVRAIPVAAAKVDPVMLPAAPVVDVKASLVQATVQELLDEVAKRTKAA